MTIDDLIAATFDREGRSYAAPPDIDQPTAAGGITLPVLEQFLGRPATISDLKALTVATATPIVRWQIDQAMTRYRFHRIVFEPLRVQLFDFGYNSGYERAIKWLQRMAGVPEAAVDGVLGDHTLLALDRWPPVLINNALAAERAYLAMNGAVAAKYAAGVARRALDFVLTTEGDQPGEATGG